MTTADVLLTGSTVAGKGAVVLSVALVAGALLRRLSAAARHLMYGLALLGVIALVPLTVMLPPWHVPVLRSAGPGAVAVETRPLAVEASPLATITREVAPPAALEPNASELPKPVAMSRDVVALLLDNALLLWVVGVALVLAYHLAGMAFVARLRRRSRRIDDPALLARRDEIARALGIGGLVELYASDAAAMPVTWGSFAPAVLLPAVWSAWSDERRNAVLQHELAHVARRDCAWQLTASVACALHWFNPMVWVVARRLRAERERACDDLVLAAGVNAYDYADHLLDVARSFRTPRITAMAAIAMARPSQLEGRLLAILDTGVARTAPSRARQAGAVVFTALLLVPTAAMLPWRAAPEPQAVSSPAPSVRKIASLSPLPPLTDTLAWTRRMRGGQWLRVYTMKSDVVVEASSDADVHVITIFGHDDGRGPRQHEFDEDDRQIEVCPALPAGVKRVPQSGCWPVDWKGEVERDNAVRTIVRVPDDILVDVKTSSGDIVATNARVPITAGSVDGSIRISSSAYTTANAVNGDVDVTLTRTEWRGAISMKTVSGRITLVLPDDASTDVEVMNSSGNARTSFPIDHAWRGAQWRMHGASRLGSGGRQVTAESWTGSIVVRRAGDADLIPLRVALAGASGNDEDPNPNPNPDVGGGSPSPSPSPSASASPSPRPRAGANVGPAIGLADGARLGVSWYDALPDQWNSLLDKPYRATLGGVTGERVALDLRGGFLRRFSRDKLRGLPDSAAMARLAQLATAQWIAYQLGDQDPGVELAGERAIWALTRSTGRSVIYDITHAIASDDWRVRAYAAWTLGELQVASAEDALIDALGDPMARVRTMAAYGLSRIRPARARVPLETLLGDPDDQVRASALGALAQIHDPRSIPAVQPLLRDPHMMVRATAESAMQVLKGR